MSTLYITRGLPASGKTTWAREWVAADPERARVNRDDLRAMLFEQPTYQWEQEKIVTKASRSAVKALLDSGVDVVADDMNLRPKYVREWQRFANAVGAVIQIVEFPITVEESVERDSKRDRVVGPEAIERMRKFLVKGALAPIPDDVATPHNEAAALYTPKPDSVPAIMVDIDGTMALMAGRSPYDLSQVGTDWPNPPVFQAVHAAASAGIAVVYCSGREEVSRKATGEWLAHHGAPCGPLFMREEGDNRKDFIVKRELFDAYIREEYDVRYVLDDRKQVVDMWRSIGLTVFQVALGDF